MRSNLQRAMGRPLALDEASAMTIGEIRAMETGGQEEAPVSGDSDQPASAEPVDSGPSKTAPIIRPSKIIDLTKDLIVRKKVSGRFAKNYTQQIVKAEDAPRAYSSPSGPSTPDRVCISSSPSMVTCVPGKDQAQCMLVYRGMEVDFLASKWWS